MVASFPGSTDYAAASSSPATFTIAKALPTVTAAVAGGTYTGKSYPATAKVAGLNGVASAALENVSPTITYYVGSGTAGQNLGGTAPTAAGTYTVVASFPGSADYAAANSNPAAFTIGKALPTLSVAGAGGTYTGNKYPAVALVAGVNGIAAASLEGVVPTIAYYTSNGTNLGTTAPSAAGSYSVIASFAGSTDYAPISSSRAGLTIGKALPIVTVADAGGAYTGSPYPATAKVAGVSGAAGASLESVTPTLIYYAGATAGSGGSSAAPTAVGTYTVVANFAGSTDYSAASSLPTTFTISKAVPRAVVAGSSGTTTAAPRKTDSGPMASALIVNDAALISFLQTSREPSSNKVLDPLALGVIYGPLQ